MRAIRRVATVAVLATTVPLLSALPTPAAVATPPAETPVAATNYQVDEPRSAPSDTTDPAWVDPVVTLPPPGEVEVDVPESGWARAGSFPVSVARPESGVVPARVRVRMLSQDEVTAAGGRLLGFEVTRADGSGSAAAVAVSLDYSGVAKAFGGNFGSRLQLARVTDCAPDVACARPRITATNDATSARLRAMSVAVRPDPSVAPAAPPPGSGFGPQDTGSTTDLVLPHTTYATTSSSGGPNGDYAASELSEADRWSVGVGSGAFTYSYPIAVPPAVAGPAPALSLDYSSQSVDGRTTSSNAQPSKVGEGWSFEPGFIERRFHSCRDEGQARDDLCWSADNEYFISFLGHSGELVRTSGTSNEWRIRGNDPGWRIVSFTECCGNGDNDGEFFVVYTPDGTKYWLGYGVEPRNTPTRLTNAAQTVPVYAGSGEPCYNAVAASSWCQQAYRWNVDRILDSRGNVTSFFYAKEKNRYSRNMTTTLPTEYDRSSYLTEVEYGQRNLAENGTAFARVRVNTMDRCVTQVACPAPTPSSQQTSYPDVPLDRMCVSVTACAADQSAPTFWSTKQIKSVQTEYWNAEASTPAYDLVSTYRMSYSFPATADGTSPSLWLTDVVRTGEYGTGSIELPGVRMAGIALPNRVNSGSGVAPMNKYRVQSISTDLGARIEVTYGTPDPCPTAPSYPAWDTNPYDCFPARYLGDWVPFHKYLVTDLVVVDARGGGASKTVHYTYAGSPAWHHADSLLTPAADQSWSDYRGYADVRVDVDGGGASAGTDTRYLVFRGMYGDKLATGGSKTDTLTDSTGAWFNDFHWRAGQTLEVKDVDSGDGHFASTLYRYWGSQTIDGPNGWESHDSNYVRPSQTIERTKNLDTGAWRDRVQDMTYSATSGQLVTSSDEASVSTTSDDTCAKWGYTDNVATGSTGGTTHWITAAPYRTITYGGTCGSGSTNVLSLTEWDYDQHAYQTAPTNVNVTQQRAYSDATTASVTKTWYDALGRVTSVVSPNEVAAGTNGATTTAYSPSTGYPYSGVTTTNVLGHQTRTLAYSAFGTPRRVEDVSNGDATSFTVDPLGRTTSVVRPGDPSGYPSYTFEYRVEYGVPNRVTTNRLLSGTAYVTSYEYLDGLGRTLQVQERDANDGGSGRRLTMTRYDTLGQVAAVSQPFGATGTPGSGLAVVALTDVPFETRHGFDSAGRVYRTAQYAAGVTQHSTDTDYRGWHHVVQSPVHSDVDYVTNVLGQVTSVVERPGSGTITTAYTYTRLGDLATITDQAGNVSSYAYDRLRRRTSSVDPDQGAWSTTYTREGDVFEVTDAKAEKVTYVYDRIRRRTHAYAGAAGGTLLAQWSYDGAGVLNSIGRLTAATSFSGGAAYTTALTGYDNRGRLTGKRWDLPAAAGALAGSYAYAFGYNLSDDLVSTVLPAAGGLAAETVTTAFNTAGLPVSLTTSLDAANPYIASTNYRLDGRLASRSLTGSVSRAYTYDAVAGRLQNVSATAPVAGIPAAIEDVTYGYDADGNVTSVSDLVAGDGTYAQRECFTYDPLNRLTAAYTTSATACGSGHVPFGADPYSASYAYDALGNLTSATTNGVTSAYTYGVPGHAHAAATIAGAAYSYDANGATTTRPTSGGPQTLAWDRLHRLSSVTGPGASTFVYDADGARLLRTTGSTTTLYLDGMELSATGSTVTATRYYGGVAMRTTSGVKVLLHNRQNSTTAAYDTAADTVAYQRYTPYGARRGGALSGTERRFLDKTEDATGLVAMGARYYDPGSARFVSVDPLADLTQPQSLAGYSYALGNPATLYDPSGLSARSPSEYEVGANCSSPCPPRPESNPNPTPTPTPNPPLPPSGGGEEDFSVGRLIGGAYDVYKKTLTFMGPPGHMALGIHEHGAGCFNQDKGQCAWLWVDLFSLGLAAAPAFSAGGRLAGEARAVGTATGAFAKEAGPAASGADSGLLVRYDPRIASRNLLGQIGDGYAVTPGGRTVSAHAAERIVYGAPGRSPTTLQRVDDILDHPTRMIYRPLNDTIRVYQGKDWVVVSGTGPQHVVTVMIR